MTFERVVDALDVWSMWANGRPVTIAELTDAAETLTESARRAPPLAAHGAHIGPSRWTDLLDRCWPLSISEMSRSSTEAPNRERAGPEIDL
jgi:hypothetical protein